MAKEQQTQQDDVRYREIVVKSPNGALSARIIPQQPAREDVVTTQTVKRVPTPVPTTANTVREDEDEEVGPSGQKPGERQVTPEAQKLIEENGLTADDVASIEGTGKDGALLKKDVQAFVDARNQG